ncbi:Helix-turn-helix domain-containing protein [Butyrivibrio proteoclasticus]|uniref:Helix-turn-helix domain-containing protein n=1 Tax=Butyrivibrio proteoclasticus TaxID=43305 RepID=A0A1I5SVP9_9FIRM|nr:Helix-turn-helix domain-containing protein [Butyrivibrio proteoclasticus]
MVEDMYVERLAERLELTSVTVSFHLKKLEDAGAVKSYKDQYYTMYSINKDIFEVNIIDILSEKTSESELQKERDDAYRKRLLMLSLNMASLKLFPVSVRRKRLSLKKFGKHLRREKNIQRKK